MKLTFLGTPSKNGGCPTAYMTDRNTVVVQGARVIDDQALAALRSRGLPDHETAVEIPMSLLPYLPKATLRSRLARLFGRSRDNV